MRGRRRNLPTAMTSAGKDSAVRPESTPRMRSVELNAFISLATISDEQGSGDRVAVKDLVDVRGMVTTPGGSILPSGPATDDAPGINRLLSFGRAMARKANTRHVS